MYWYNLQYFLPWYFEVCVPEATPGTDGQLAPVCLGGLSLGLFIIIIVIIIIIIIITIVID